MNMKYKISDLFSVVSGKTTNPSDYPKGNVPFISATEKNNGVSALIDADPSFSENLITISRNGSVCEVFYHPIPFCASLDDIRVLIPKNFKLNKYIAFYICTLIKKEKFRYTYGRKYGTNRIKETEIKLPANKDNEPDWLAIESIIKQKISLLDLKVSSPIHNEFDFAPIQKQKISLTDLEWKEFQYGGKDGIFIIKNGYYNKKPMHTEIGDVPFIGATEYNNGVTEFYSPYDIENNHKDERSKEHPLKNKIFEGNCVTVSNNGSVGYAFYQNNNFTCTHDVNVLYLKDREWNKYTAMFICTLIRLEQYRWNYGRKWRPTRMPDSIIKLPVNDNGNPNWEFMENYIKSLPYSASI